MTLKLLAKVLLKVNQSWSDFLLFLNSLPTRCRLIYCLYPGLEGPSDWPLDFPQTLLPLNGLVFKILQFLSGW